MLSEGHLYTYINDNNEIVGGAVLFVEETKQIPPMMAKRLDLIMQNEQLMKDYIEGHNRENARNLRLGKNIEFYELKTDEKEL